MNSTVLNASLESVSIQTVQMVATTNQMIAEIGLKSTKMDSNEQEIIKKSGDAMQNVLNYFSEVSTADRIDRQLTENEEKMEGLEADPQFFLKDRLNEMENQMYGANNIISIEKERLVAHTIFQFCCLKSK